jgi:hypothetical protein
VLSRARLTLVALPSLTLFAGACALDWGSLEPLEGGTPDAPGNDVVNFPDAKHDAPPDGANDVATNDSPDEPDVDQGDADAGVDAPADAGPDVVVDSGPDAATDASDGGVPDADAGCAYTISGTLATYNFSGELGSQTSTAASSTASGITAGAISRSSALTAQAGANSINSSNWSLTTLDSTRYYTFSITPPTSCALAITSVSLDTGVSPKGPANGAVATSADSFVSTSSFTPGTSSSVTLSVTGATTTIEVRVYGYNAMNTGGTMRVQNTMKVSGSLK